MIKDQLELASLAGSVRLANLLMLGLLGPLCGPSRMNSLLQGATLGREAESNQGFFIIPSSASSISALAMAQR